MFPLLDIPVETTECGMQTKWDNGDVDGRWDRDGWYHGDSDSDSVDDWCDGNGDGTRNGDASATAMGNIRSHGNSDGADVYDLCNDGKGDGMRDRDASVTDMDGLTATVVEQAMTTVRQGQWWLDGNNCNGRARWWLRRLKITMIYASWQWRYWMHSYLEAPVMQHNVEVHLYWRRGRRIFVVPCCARYGSANAVARSLYSIINIRLGQMWLQRGHASPVSSLRSILILSKEQSLKEYHMSKWLDWLGAWGFMLANHLTHWNRQPKWMPLSSTHSRRG